MSTPTDKLVYRAQLYARVLQLKDVQIWALKEQAKIQKQIEVLDKEEAKQ